MAPKKNLKHRSRATHEKPNPFPPKRVKQTVVSPPLTKIPTAAHPMDGIPPPPGSNDASSSARNNVRSAKPGGNSQETNSLGKPKPFRGRSAERTADRPATTRIIPISTGFDYPLELPSIGDHSSPRDVSVLLDIIAHYFRKWSDPNLIEGPVTVCEDMSIIAARLQQVASMPDILTSLPDIFDGLYASQWWSERFIHLWGPAIRMALWKMLSQLEIQTSAAPTTIHESEFSRFIRWIQAVSVPLSFTSPITTGDNLMPVLVSAHDARHMTELCNGIHDNFQDLTYRPEKKLLWLLVWKSLKRTFILFQKNDLTYSDSEGHIHLLFFGKPGVTQELLRLTLLPDAANPRGIENMCGKYCRFIATCRGTDERYLSLLQSPADRLQAHVLASLRRFIKTGKLEPTTLMSLRIAVVRLNQLNGGPVVLRRWRDDPKTTSGDNLSSLHSLSAGSAYPSPVSQGHPSDNASYGARNKPTIAPSGNSTEPSQARINTANEDGAASPRSAMGMLEFSTLYPEGLNMKSAFDYVYYPFPETRAYEVAQSEQFCREMAEPGINSDGLRPDCLVNRPLRHTRDPAELSIFTSRRKLGPLGWIKSQFRRLVPETRYPRPPRSFVPAPLASRKMQSAMTRSKRRAVLDPKSRVNKTAARNSAVKLRGGSGGGRSTSQAARSQARSRTHGTGRPAMPGSQRQPLGVITTYPALLGLPEDDDDESGGVSLNDSNQENQPPQDSSRDGFPDRSSPGLPYVDGPCHPCPQFPGQYHHVCQCDPPIVIYEDTDDFLRICPDQNEEESLANTTDSWATTETTEEENLVSTPNSWETIETFEEDSDSEDSTNKNAGSAQGVARPELTQRQYERRHPDDHKLAHSLFDPDSEFQDLVRDFGRDIGMLNHYLEDDNIFLLETPEQESDRRDISKILEGLVEQTSFLRTAYLEPLDSRIPVYVDNPPNKDKRRHSNVLPASTQLVQRAFIECCRSFDDIHDMVNPMSSRTNLSLRHSLCRLIRGVGELQCLFDEFSRGLKEEAQEVETATDSEEFLSDDEKQRLSTKVAGASGLPTRAEYETMFKDELERELLKERKVGRIPRSGKKDQLIQMLMDEDQQGNVGCGAYHGFRAFNPKSTVRSRPAGFELEKAIADYKNDLSQQAAARRRAGKFARKQRRKDHGLSPTAGRLGSVDPATFGRVQALSRENSVEWSESESTAE